MSLLKPKPKIVILFDVGSSSVGSGIFAVARNAKPEMIFSSRTDMAFQENFKFERFITSMLDALQKSVDAAAKFSLPPHSSVELFCFLASPWYASQTRVLKKYFDAPMKIDVKLLEDIHNKEVEDFSSKEIERMGKDAVVLETRNIQTKLNGYETFRPVGKEAQELSAAIYVSISPGKIVSSITDKIRHPFGNAHLKFFSFPFASYISIRDIFHEKSFLFMDISGEASDISIVRDNVLQETVSFPFGKNYLIRRIASESGASFYEAVSRFKMSEGGELDEKEQRKMKKALDSASRQWSEEFRKAIDPIAGKNGLLPRDLFLTADDDVSMWFSSCVQDAGSEAYSIVGNVFQIRHVNAQFLSTFLKTAPRVDRDPFLLVEGLFIQREIHF